MFSFSPISYHRTFRWLSNGLIRSIVLSLSSRVFQRTCVESDRYVSDVVSQFLLGRKCCHYLRHFHFRFVLSITIDFRILCLMYTRIVFRILYFCTPVTFWLCAIFLGFTNDRQYYVWTHPRCYVVFLPLLIPELQLTHTLWNVEAALGFANDRQSYFLDALRVAFGFVYHVWFKIHSRHYVAYRTTS